MSIIWALAREVPTLSGGNTVDEHISKMKSLWNGFPPDQKPEWLTWEQILDYEKAMRGDTK